MMAKSQHTRLLRSVTTIFAVAAAIVVLSSLAEACPTCKTGLEDEAAGGNLIRGYFWSIIFMMATPFAILGCFSGYLYHAVRKARRDAEQIAEEQDDDI